MLIEIALNSSYGRMPMNGEIKKIMENNNYSGITRRRQVASYLQEKAEIKDLKNPAFDINDWFKKHRDSIIMLKCPIPLYYLWDDKTKCIGCITVETVDTDKMWTIGEYDGAESVKYLEPKVIEEEYNYYSF